MRVASKTAAVVDDDDGGPAAADVAVMAVILSLLLLRLMLLLLFFVTFPGRPPAPSSRLLRRFCRRKEAPGRLGTDSIAEKTGVGAFGEGVVGEAATEATPAVDLVLFASGVVTSVAMRIGGTRPKWAAEADGGALPVAAALVGEQRRWAGVRLSGCRDASAGPVAGWRFIGENSLVSAAARSAPSNDSFTEMEGALPTTGVREASGVPLPECSDCAEARRGSSTFDEEGRCVVPDAAMLRRGVCAATSTSFAKREVLTSLLLTQLTTFRLLPLLLLPPLEGDMEGRLWRCSFSDCGWSLPMLSSPCLGEEDS